VGMGASLWQCSSAARELFAEAELATGLPLTRVVFEGPSEQLTDTAFAQPGVVATSLAAAEALDELLRASAASLAPVCCAGHSVGELAALARAGALTLFDAMKLVAARGRLMAEASAVADGSMAAVLGLEEPALVEVCLTASRETGASVQVANLNAPGQIVLSGNRKALVRAAELAKVAGARRVMELDVSGPFHSVYMQPASEGFRSFVEGTPVLPTSIPVVLNVSALPSQNPDEIKRELVMQVSSPVRWADSVKAMVDLGCTVFVELGPGQVLSGLVKRIAKEATVLNVEDEGSLRSTADKLLPLL